MAYLPITPENFPCAASVFDVVPSSVDETGDPILSDVIAPLTVQLTATSSGLLPDGTITPGGILVDNFVEPHTTVKTALDAVTPNTPVMLISSGKWKGTGEGYGQSQGYGDWAGGVNDVIYTGSGNSDGNEDPDGPSVPNNVNQRGSTILNGQIAIATYPGGYPISVQEPNEVWSTSLVMLDPVAGKCIYYYLAEQPEPGVIKRFEASFTPDSTPFTFATSGAQITVHQQFMSFMALVYPNFLPTDAQAEEILIDHFNNHSSNNKVLAPWFNARARYEGPLMDKRFTDGRQEAEAESYRIVGDESLGFDTADGPPRNLGATTSTLAAFINGSLDGLKSSVMFREKSGTMVLDEKTGAVLYGLWGQSGCDTATTMTNERFAIDADGAVFLFAGDTVNNTYTYSGDGSAVIKMTVNGVEITNTAGTLTETITYTADFKGSTDDVKMAVIYEPDGTGLRRVSLVSQGITVIVDHYLPDATFNDLGGGWRMTDSLQMQGYAQVYVFDVIPPGAASTLVEARTSFIRFGDKDIIALWNGADHPALGYPSNGMIYYDAVIDSQSTLLENHAPDRGFGWKKIGGDSANFYTPAGDEVAVPPGSGLQWSYYNFTHPITGAYRVTASLGFDADDTSGGIMIRSDGTSGQIFWVNIIRKAAAVNARLQLVRYNGPGYDAALADVDLTRTDVAASAFTLVVEDDGVGRIKAWTVQEPSIIIDENTVVDAGNYNVGLCVDPAEPNGVPGGLNIGNFICHSFNVQPITAIS